MIGSTRNLGLVACVKSHFEEDPTKTLIQCLLVIAAVGACFAARLPLPTRIVIIVGCSSSAIALECFRRKPKKPESPPSAAERRIIDEMVKKAGGAYNTQDISQKTWAETSAKSLQEKRSSYRIIVPGSWGHHLGSNRTTVGLYLLGLKIAICAPIFNEAMVLERCKMVVYLTQQAASQLLFQTDIGIQLARGDVMYDYEIIDLGLQSVSGHEECELFESPGRHDHGQPVRRQTVINSPVLNLVRQIAAVKRIEVFAPYLCKFIKCWKPDRINQLAPSLRWKRLESPQVRAFLCGASAGHHAKEHAKEKETPSVRSFIEQPHCDPRVLLIVDDFLQEEAPQASRLSKVWKAYAEAYIQARDSDTHIISPPKF